MGTIQQRPDGTWEPAKPLGFQPGYDVERYVDRWVLYRTTRERSVEIASGKSAVKLFFTYWRHRLRNPLR